MVSGNGKFRTTLVALTVCPKASSWMGSVLTLVIFIGAALALSLGDGSV